MRFPTIHTFLKWFGPSFVAFCGGSLGLIAALSVPFPRVKEWAEREFDIWWPFMSAPWFLATGAAIIAAYIWALAYTGKEVKTGLAGYRGLSWLERRADNRLRAKLALASPDEAATLIRLEMERVKRPRQSIFRRAISVLPFRRSEQPSNSSAPQPQDDRRAFDEAWQERTTDRIPFVRLRDIAPEFGLDLSSSETPTANLAYDIEGALRQAAVDGDLQVWGRKYHGPVQSNDPLLKIPASHFAEFEFGHGNLHYQTENRFSHTGKITKRLEELAGQAYYDLQLSDSDARAVLRQYAKDHPQ
jgi:hypothetical protein